MAASGLTPGSDAWNERLESENKRAAESMSELRWGSTALQLRDIWETAVTGRGGRNAEQANRMWQSYGGSAQSFYDKTKELFDKEQSRVDAVKSGGDSGDPDTGIGLPRYNRFASTMNAATAMLKGEAALRESGIDYDLEPFEMYAAGMWGVDTPKKSAQEAGMEEARQAGRGQAGASDKRAAAGMVAPTGDVGMTLGMEEEDQSRQPWM